MQSTVDLVYFDAGGGHRAAALALREALSADPGRWRVRLVHLFEVLDPQQRVRRWTGRAPEDLYNRRLARGWTLGLGGELRLLQQLIRLAHGPLCRRLARHWAASPPDLVVSLIPNFNRALADSIDIACPAVPFVTVLTDLADLPPRFWIEPGTRQHVVCGTPHAAAQARAAGVSPQCVSSVSGMLLRQAFHARPPIDRQRARASLGLHPTRPTAAVMYGGQGSREMLRIAGELPDVQLILFAGRNRELAQRLRSARSEAPRLVLEFTERVADRLALADYFIGKPGPGCLSEALQMGLPVITFDSAWTIPQERFNARWVRELGVGLVLRSACEVRSAAAEMHRRLPEFRRRVGWIDNRAAAEVPVLLDELVRQARLAQPLPRSAADRPSRPAALTVGAGLP